MGQQWISLFWINKRWAQSFTKTPFSIENGVFVIYSRDTSGRLIIKSALKRIDLEEQLKGLYLLKVNTNGEIQEFKVFEE